MKPANRPTHSIGWIRDALTDLANVPAIRSAIVDLMFHHLRATEESLDDWQKVHFLNAISALALNVNSLQQPTASWLRLCLVDLEKAITPSYQRGNDLPPRNIDLELITFERLMEALDSIGRQIG